MSRKTNKLRAEVRRLEQKLAAVRAQCRANEDRASRLKWELRHCEEDLDKTLRERNHYRSRLDSLVFLQSVESHRLVNFTVSFSERSLKLMLEDHRLMDAVRTQVAGHAMDQALQFFLRDGWMSASPPDSVWQFDSKKKNGPWARGAF